MIQRGFHLFGGVVIINLGLVFSPMGGTRTVEFIDMGLKP